MKTQQDHEEAKQSIRSSAWRTVATFGATFSRGAGVGACDVEVQAADRDGQWYLRTSDDAGGSDECDATPYADRGAATAAAKEIADDRDECDGLSAEAWLEREREQAIEDAKSDDGEWVLASKDGTRWDDDRYLSRAGAEAAIAAWYEDVQAANPGTDIIWHLMETPELARLTDAGLEMVREEAE